MRTRPFLTAVALLILLASCAAMAVAQATTPATESEFLYNSQHSGVAPSPITVPIPMNWKFTVPVPAGAAPQHVIATPAVDQDTVYIFVGANLYAVRRDNGAAKWKQPLTMPNMVAVDSTPLVRDGVAMFGGRDGQLHFVELQADQGARIGFLDLKIAHRPLPGVTLTPDEQNPKIQSSPMYHDGKVYFGGDDGWVFALDFATRQKLWDFRTNGPVRASPAYYNHGIYVASMDGSVCGLAESTGRLRWKTALTDIHGDPVKNLLTSPVLTYSKVLVAADKSLFACDQGGYGYVRWRFEAHGNIVGTPAVWDDPAGGEGRVFFGDSDGCIYCLDVGTGEVIWRSPPRVQDPNPNAGPVGVSGFVEPVKSSPTIVKGAVVFRCGPRQVNGYSIANGKLLWHYDLPEAAGLAWPVAAPAAGGLGSPVGPALPGLGGARGGLAGAGGGGGIGLAGGLGGRGNQPQAPQPTVIPETPLVFEQEVSSSIVATSDGLLVQGDDGALYCFSNQAADGVAPEFDSVEMEMPGQGARVQRPLKLYDTVEKATAADPQRLKLPGAPPIYIRAKVFDEGSGINPQSVRVAQESGGGGDWAPGYDAKGGYVWATYEPSGGSALNDKFGEGASKGLYVISLAVSDWFGNVRKVAVSFVIDNAAPVPGSVAGPGGGGGRRGGGGGGGFGMPGMGGGGMGMPGMGGGRRGGGGE